MQNSSETPDVNQAGAILSIDLGAIRQNYRTLRSRLTRGRCAAVVKANGYGLGAAQVAKSLMEDGCDTFFVAHVAEGIELERAVGRNVAIYILNGIPPGAEAQCAAAGLIPVLNGIEQLYAWRDTSRRLGKALPAALQVDSGMSRLGLSPSEVDAITADPAALDGIELKLVMSHLACADEPGSPANALQLRNFEALRAKLPPAPASLANSSGIFLGGGIHFDLARPGAALYGVNPTPYKPNPMRQVVSLAAKVIQTRTLEEGAGVGYGHSYRAGGGLSVATISLGYADGWPRHAASRAFHDGVPLPFAGRVSMDSIVLDISALPAGTLRAGDAVELIGAHQTVDDVAALAGTIGYEILTGLGSRFHRIYEGG
ncbi:alanine racemase [Mesorhizobium sp. WSM2239]|uniref:Alanine racemase n=2 Tax=unclassified Mesorhizobium TaxID=325217 RepID=A0AAU8DB71_9HYPH